MEKLSSRVLIVFLFLWALVSCTPILSNPSYYVALLAVAVFMLIACNGILIKHKSVVFWTLSYIVLIFMYKIIGYSSAAWGNYMNQLLFFVPILMMLLVSDKLSRKQNKFLWWGVVAIMLFNVYDNIRLSQLYPQINTSRYYLEEEFLQSINAGGTPFYTFSLFFFMVSFFVFLNAKQRIAKIMSLVCSITAAVYICAYCFKASVVVYFIFSVVFLLYANIAKSRFLFLGILAGTGILAVVFVEFFTKEIVDFIISISPSERLTTRLVTLLDEENENANLSTVTGRANLYMLSLKTWLSDVIKFIYGMGDHRVQHGAKAVGIGQHSDLLDSLARYGLFGLITLFFVFKYAFRFILSFYDKKYRLQLFVIFFFLIMCGLTKGIFYSGIGCVVFLLLPLSRVYVNENQQ